MLFGIFPCMRKHLEKIKRALGKKRLDPNKPEERRELIDQAVQRTIREYGEALKKLGAE